MSDGIRQLAAQILDVVAIELQGDHLTPSARNSLESLRDLAHQAMEMSRPSSEQPIPGQLLLEDQIEQDQSE